MFNLEPTTKIHILFHGAALCGAGVPSDWLKGERWISIKDDIKLASCKECQDEYIRRS